MGDGLEDARGEELVQELEKRIYLELGRDSIGAARANEPDAGEKAARLQAAFVAGKLPRVLYDKNMRAMGLEPEPGPASAERRLGRRGNTPAILMTLTGASLVFIGFVGTGIGDISFASLELPSSAAVDSIIALRGAYTVLIGIGFLAAFVGLGLTRRVETSS